jgi:hypothetical protein
MGRGAVPRLAGNDKAPVIGEPSVRVVTGRSRQGDENDQ